MFGRKPWRDRRARPGTLMLLGLLGVVLVGAALLSLPAMTPAGAPLDPLDALFTSTSAVCVTGLIVRDTGSGFTFAGQVLLLLLIQLGGLGIMSVSGAASLLLGQGIGLRNASYMREVFAGKFLQEARAILRLVLGFTLLAELFGAVLLFAALGGSVPDVGTRAWLAVFHAVSAFCNAGFSLWDDSLMGQAGSAGVVAVITTLLMVGGLGFAVTANLFAWLRGREGRSVRVATQTRVVVLGTVGLLVIGAVLLLLLEWRGAFAGAPPLQKFGLALFQSATTRTAGFNSMDLTLLSPASLLVMIVLMFIGAGPGSTAGGVKLTTLAVLVANVRAIAAGRGEPRLFDREVGLLAVRRATMVVNTYLATAVVAVFALLVTEQADPLTTVFETVSALGTVGLSLGLTPELSVPGRFIVVLLMLIGRAGPLALAYGVVREARDRNVRYPSTGLQIG